MVNYKKIFNELLSGKHPLDLDAANQMIDLLKIYPYLQPAQVLVTKYLKDKSLFYKDALQKAAVLTLDRKVLFHFIEGNPFVHKKGENLYQKNNNPAKDVNDNESVKASFTEEIPEKVAPKNDEKTISIEQQPEKMRYLDWLQELSGSKELIYKDLSDPIERFLQNKPKIVPKRDKTTAPPAIIDKSVVEKQMLMTETLANLYLKQKKYDKAIQAFKILSLKYPKKSSYFANQISEIKGKLK